MTDLELRQLVDAAAQALRPLLNQSEPLRRVCSLLGKLLTEEAQRAANASPATGDKQGATQTPSVEDPKAKPPMQSAGADRPVPELEPRQPFTKARPTLPVSEAVVPLKLGHAVVQLPVSGTEQELEQAIASGANESAESTSGFDRDSYCDIDLSLIEKRCRIKADSCRLYIERRAAAADPVAEREVLHRRSQMVAMAKAMPNCFLWVFMREQVQPSDAILTLIAQCYEAQAEAVALVQQLSKVASGRLTEEDELALHLLAQANSALRVVLGHTWLYNDDRDQADVHVWLRRETSARRVFVARHMTADDPADPADTASLRSRIQAQSARLEKREADVKKINNTIGKIRYHADQLSKGQPDQAMTHWSTISEAVLRLEGMGITSADRRIVEAIEPAVAYWPEDATGFDHLAGIIARASSQTREAQKTQTHSVSSEVRPLTAEVLEVREMLRGLRMVIIGGTPNVEAAERLKQAFELKEAEWVELTEHGSSEPMRSPISRPDTAVVLVIIKLTGHLHAEEARKYARQSGKPCVMLTRGYNPDRVAAEIQSQASARLGQLAQE